MTPARSLTGKLLLADGLPGWLSCPWLLHGQLSGSLIPGGREDLAAGRGESS